MEEERYEIRKIIEQLYDILDKNNYNYFLVALVVTLEIGVHNFDYYMDDTDLADLLKMVRITDNFFDIDPKEVRELVSRGGEDNEN